MFKFLFIFYYALFVTAVVNAQSKKTGKQRLLFSALYQSMKSTHGNLFRSGSLSLTKMITKRYEAGFGVETAFASIHHDNGFVLYKLKFIPAFGNIKYHFKRVGRFDIYAESYLGVSFNSYNRATDEMPEIKTRIKEKGIYTYLGGGIRYPISKKINLVTGIGFKGYKMSFNVFDINPHGVSGVIGFNFMNI